LRLSDLLGLVESSQAFEAYDDIAFTPACRATVDLPVVEPIRAAVDTATVVGVRAGFTF